MSNREDMLALESGLEDSREADREITEQACRYRASAHRLGVEFIGIVKKHLIVLFQDPMTGSSFAVRMGEPVESGIRRVRERFGVS